MTTVTVIATGGTIASFAATPGGPVTAGLTGDSLLEALHTRPEGIDLRVENFDAVGSYALDLATIHRLCATIDRVLEEDEVAGVVVAHGTDTMEESAYLADLLVRSDKPVVFTGAQRHAGTPDTDGPRNIADAIRCAASPALRGQGAVILFEGDFHAAREVTKVHTSRVDTFRSPGLGKLGEVDGSVVHLYRQRPAREVLATSVLDPDVELILLGMGSTPKYLDYCADANVSGVVLAAFGRGNAPKGFADAARRLVDRGVPVVVASRCAEGRVQPVYGGDSGGTTLAEAGVIFAGSLQPVKARLRLSALLGADTPTTEIREAFAD
ncbi:asparaginase [Poseidonocella pacifica]|uniref:Asparaginase n=1 Tax=Poseidonocella pacifica TaxID=871651 RepID=A0A1I0X4S4_9RHOB|nr:asparaginase [Poseidonocella pacifica]SFA96042.1 asparaginase [Poseidonocella pacifica]